MSSWAALETELALWRAKGLRPRLWWRDDDAQDVTPALERLLDLSQAHAVPVHIAVIPQGMSAALAPRLRDTDHAHVLQHGLAHVNHAPKGTPASELSAPRALAAQQADLARGREILQRATLPRLLPGLVPPWNRIGDATRRALPLWGYGLLSAYEGRGDSAPVPGLSQIDAHLDPVRWKYGRVFRGEDKMLAMLVTHLRNRRETAPARPIGYVTHHLQTGEDIWAFTDRLFAATRGLWTSLPELMESGGG